MVLGRTNENRTIVKRITRASPVWGGLPKYLADELDSTQNRCLDIIGISGTVGWEPQNSSPTAMRMGMGSLTDLCAQNKL